MAKKGSDETKRQKKLAQQKAARKQRLDAGGRPAPRVTGAGAAILSGVSSEEARHFKAGLVEQPLVAAWGIPGWQEEHMASIVIARRLPDGHVAAGGFLVDLYGLGLKDGWAHVFGDEAHLRRFTSGMPNEDVDYAAARQVILAGEEWARLHGFRVAPEWEVIRHLIEPVQPGEELPMDLFGDEKGEPLVIVRLP